MLPEKLSFQEQLILKWRGGSSVARDARDGRDGQDDSELLNGVYREISENLGMEVAISIHQMFKGQQINFPVRLLNSAQIQRRIVEEYDGTNIRLLAVKYDYSEKTIRRIIHESMEK